MPNRKNKNAMQMKQMGEAQNEKKALLPTPPQPPIIPPRRLQPPRRQPPASSRRQPPSSSSPKGEQQEYPPQEDPSMTSIPYQANRDWRVLRNSFLPHETTIEMMYTGQEYLPEDEEEQQQYEPFATQNGLKPSFPRIEARPGITHAKVHLPPGVLPSTNYLPDMCSYINAIDFFAHPERHQPDPNAGPRTTVTVTPKAQTPKDEGRVAASSSTMEVVPLGTYQGPPLEPGFLNMAFQTFSTMDFSLDTSDGGASTDPNRTAYHAEISPTLMLTMQQQHRLQAAVLQDEVPLVDALMPIEQDIRKEYAEMRQPSATLPLPYATMEIFSMPAKVPSSPQASRAGGFHSEPKSVPVSGYGAPHNRMVVMPTPRLVPLPTNCRNPPQRYPVFVQPNVYPRYGIQGPSPRYPVLFIPNYYANWAQHPPRYPVILQPRFVPCYGPQPPRYPLFVHPNYIPNNIRPAPRPYSYGRPFFNHMQ